MKTQENSVANAVGGKLDDTFPDGLGKPGGTEASTTTREEYDFKQHVSEISSSMKETAMYGGHGIEARAAGINVPPDSDRDGDYDSPTLRQPGTNIGGPDDK